MWLFIARENTGNTLVFSKLHDHVLNISCPTGKTLNVIKYKYVVSETDSVTCDQRDCCNWMGNCDWHGGGNDVIYKL